MAIEPRDQLKTYFETGDIPTQDQFDAVLDSYVHKTDDGITIYNVPSTTEIYFGINTLIPEAPLGITAMSDDDTLAGFNKVGDTTATWFFNLNPENGAGFNIDQSLISGRTSRFFIQESDGNVGIGSTTPTQKLEVEASSGNNVTALRIVNTATVANNGFILGHEHNGSEPGINGSFSISENEFSQTTKRIVVRPGGNVGVNMLEPDTKLHIGGNLASPSIDLDLIEGTGLVTIGPMEANLIFDYEGVQARVGNYVGTVLNLTASTLNFQRLGGDALFYGDDSFDDTDRTILKEGSFLGIGTVNPTQRIDVAGAIRIQTTDQEFDGSIRYSGDDFEGFMAGEWHSFTSGGGGGGGPWIQEDTVIYYKQSGKTFVGIGTSDPESTLDIVDTEHVTHSNIALSILTNAITTGREAVDIRIGLQVANTGDWGNPKGKDIGFYISEVSGVDNPRFNIAAAMDGNVLIGNPTDNKVLFGNSAQRVFSIQPGTAPDPGPFGATAQLYSQPYGADDVVTLHVMRGDGTVVMLYQETGLTEEDDTPISDTEYTAVEAAVINRLRTRIDELEDRLRKIGFLGAPVPAP